MRASRRQPSAQPNGVFRLRPSSQCRPQSSSRDRPRASCFPRSCAVFQQARVQRLPSARLRPFSAAPHAALPRRASRPQRPWRHPSRAAVSPRERASVSASRSQRAGPLVLPALQRAVPGSLVALRLRPGRMGPVLLQAGSAQVSQRVVSALWQSWSGQASAPEVREPAPGWQWPAWWAQRAS